MDTLCKISLLKQFEATLDMFDNALRACPEKLWTAPMWNEPGTPPGFSDFWYVAYHTLFWLDLYLSGSVESFQPPEPYTLDELDPRGVLPGRVYTRQELLSYLAHSRQKCRVIMKDLTDEQAQNACYFSWKKGSISYLELLLDTMRHVQEHAAQLNMFIGQQAGITSKWIA